MRTTHLLGSTAIVLVIGSFAAFAQPSTEDYEYDSLGRLVKVDTTGGQNNDQVHAICYDDAGNRVQYNSTNDGTNPACSSSGTPTPTPTPSLTPTPSPTPTPTPPPPSNTAPTATDDFASGQCLMDATVNLTANDSDAEGNYPLTLVSISSANAGQAGANIVSASSVNVSFATAGDFSLFTYTVRDSLGATSTAQLNVSTSSCGGGFAF